MRQRILTIFTILFFWGMLFLTCFAEAIHNAGLTHVKTETLKYKLFSVTVDGDGRAGETARQKCYAADAEIAKREENYIVITDVKNGEERTFLKRVYLTFGEEEDGYYPILEGDYNGEMVVIDPVKNLMDGEEVIVVEN